jgi:hypothetical protein
MLETEREASVRLCPVKPFDRRASNFGLVEKFRRNGTGERESW